MEEITVQVAAETLNVLYNTELYLFCKIPYEIIYVLQEKAKEYTKEVKIDFSKSFLEQGLCQDTLGLLALIYKDYFCDEEEKKKIAESLFKLEESKKEKYNVDVFKNKTKHDVHNKDEHHENITSLTIPQKWYKKLFKNILKIFK